MEPVYLYGPTTMESEKHLDQILKEAWTHRVSGALEKAGSLLNLAEDLCGPDDHKALGRLCHIRMQLELDRGLPETAIPFGEEALAHYEKTHDDAQIAHALRHLADVMLQLELLELAQEYYEKALRYYGRSQKPSRIALANTHRGYALLLERMGRGAEACRVWEIAKAHYAHHGIKAGVKEAERNLARLS